MRLRGYATLAVAVLVACATEGEDSDLALAHRAVWEAWFAGDSVRLRELLPEDLVAINTGGGEWSTREEMVHASADFHRQGGRLVSLDFPRQEIQRYGDVAIVYSDYAVVSHVGADTTKEAGRATEVFVRRDGAWVNPGWHLDSGE